MKKDSELYKKIRVYCYIVGLIVFLTALIVGAFLLHNLEKDEKTTGKIVVMQVDVPCGALQFHWDVSQHLYLNCR
ncbi:hypothetical protein DW928_10310 [Firmicutes bacterium AM43-11BH]|nr:hypothetical protein DW928_10310 [Firmicutes bacterium AM43-11BH]